MGFLSFRVQDSGQLVTFTPTIVAIAGYTGRDQAAVRAHIAELAEQGIAPPPRTPILYPVTADRAQVSEVIEVTGAGTSGEAEFVLILTAGTIYVGLGSDHTDRDLEKLSIPAAKQVCPKVIGPEVWPLAEVEGHWDRLILRSWTGPDRRPYQEGMVDALLHPRNVLRLAQEQVTRPLDQAIISCGTLPLIGGSFRFESPFAAELVDPVRDRRLTLTYRVEPLDWLRG